SLRRLCRNLSDRRGVSGGWQRAALEKIACVLQGDGAMIQALIEKRAHHRAYHHAYQKAVDDCLAGLFRGFPDGLPSMRQSVGHSLVRRGEAEGTEPRICAVQVAVLLIRKLIGPLSARERQALARAF